MSCNNYFEHHQTLIKALYLHCQQQLPFCSEQSSQVDDEFLTLLKTLSEATHFSEQMQAQGQAVITRIIAHYPHITPEVNRDLLWFFAGECLHYMADEELDQYQALDELLNSNTEENIEYAVAKAKVFKLH